MRKGTVIRCDEAAWRLGGISLAGWNVVVSLLVLALSLRAADESALSLWSIYVEMRQQIADRRVDFRKAVKNAMPQPPEKPAFDNENRLFGLPPLR